MYRPKSSSQLAFDAQVTYTLREVDLRYEADNAETFAAYFKDDPKVRFPHIYRKFSSRDVLCMEYFHGIKPDEQKKSA